MTDLVLRAKEFATKAHESQFRKYNNQPYITHPERVVCAISGHTLYEDVLVAAWLHDVVEDTNISLETIRQEFGENVAKIVNELTNVYTKENYPNLNRKERKKLELERLSKISNEAKLIKTFDRIDNLDDLILYNEVKQYYIDESIDLFKVIKIEEIITEKSKKYIDLIIKNNLETCISYLSATDTWD